MGEEGASEADMRDARRCVRQVESRVRRSLVVPECLRMRALVFLSHPHQRADGVFDDMSTEWHQRGECEDEESEVGRVRLPEPAGSATSTRLLQRRRRTRTRIRRGGGGGGDGGVVVWRREWLLGAGGWWRHRPWGGPAAISTRLPAIRRVTVRRAHRERGMHQEGCALSVCCCRSACVVSCVESVWCRVCVLAGWVGPLCRRRREVRGPVRRGEARSRLERDLQADHRPTAEDEGKEGEGREERKE